jgi:hypothetical protein
MYRKLPIYLTTYPWVGLREWLVCELSEQSYIWARVGCVEHLLKHLLLLELLLLDGKLPIVVWQLQEVCNCRSKIVEPSIYWFVDRCGKGADWKRFSQSPCAYLNNVDVGQPLWRVDKSCVSCAFTSYLSCMIYLMLILAYPLCFRFDLLWYACVVCSNFIDSFEKKNYGSLTPSLVCAWTRRGDFIYCRFSLWKTGLTGFCAVCFTVFIKRRKFKSYLENPWIPTSSARNFFKLAL